VSVTTGKSNVSVEDINAGRAQASYGNQVVIRDINGRLHQYNHLDSVAQFREGQAIQKGQTIGTMWNTWSSTNVHLDYRVQSERWWEDPRQFMSNTVDTKDEIATLDSFLQKRSSTPGGNITSKVKPPYVNQIIQEDIGRFELSTEEFKKLTEIPGANVDSKITTKYRLEKFAQKDTAQYSSDDMVDVLRKLFDKNEWSEASILQMAVYTWKLDDWIFENGIFNDGYGYDMLQEYFDDPDDTIKEIKKNLEANWYIVKKQESGNVYAGDEIDTTGMDLLTNEGIVEKSLGKLPVSETPKTPNVTQESEGFLKRNSYNPVNMWMEWAESFKLWWNHIKVKMQEEDELKELSKYPISDLSKTDQERVYKYAQDKKQYDSKILSPLWEDIRDSVVESFVRAWENIKWFELYRPDEGIIDIMQRWDLDNIDKLESSIKVLWDVAYQNIAGNFDKETYMQVTGEYANSAAEKIKSSLNEETWGTTDRLAALWAGTVEFLFAPLWSIFDERNSWAITATVWQALDSTMVVLRSTVQETSKQLWFSDATAENFSILTESFIPSKVAKDKLAGMSENAALKNAIWEIKWEIKNLYGIDPEVRDAYIAAKSEQYGNFTYIKWVEKFDAQLEEARKQGDIDSILELQRDIQKYNSDASAEIYGNIKANIGVSLDNLASWIGAKLNFIDNGKQVPYLDLSKIWFGKWWDALLKQDINKNAISDLSQYWSDKWLWDLKKSEIKASVDEYLKETWLSQVQKNTFTNNLVQELQIEREKQRVSVENLHKIALEKAEFKDKYSQAKQDNFDGVISDKQLDRARRDYEKTLDTPQDRKKFEEIKLQESFGNIIEVWSEDWFTLYNWTNKGLQFMRPEARATAIGYHYPTKLKNKIESDADGKIVESIVKKKADDFEAMRLSR